MDALYFSSPRFTTVRQHAFRSRSKFVTKMTSATDNGTFVDMSKGLGEDGGLANGKKFKLIATDVDGTLLNSRQELTVEVEQSIRKACDLGVPLVLATGKARGPWIHDVLPRLPQPMPGVFMQGLLVCDADGSILYEKKVDHDVAYKCIDFANAHGLTLTFYCGDRIICEETDEHTDRIIFYKEPTPEAVGPLDKWVGKITIHKMIFMGQHDKILEIRPLLEKCLLPDVSITTALKGMIEVLPPGCSKGSGLAWLLNKLDVNPDDIMAMGDGENDVEMLKLAGFAVAMGNGGHNAKSVADAVVSTNDKNGVAEAIEKYVLKKGHS